MCSIQENKRKSTQPGIRLLDSARHSVLGDPHVHVEKLIERARNRRGEVKSLASGHLPVSCLSQLFDPAPAAPDRASEQVQARQQGRPVSTDGSCTRRARIDPSDRSPQVAEVVAMPSNSRPARALSSPSPDYSSLYPDGSRCHRSSETEKRRPVYALVKARGECGAWRINGKGVATGSPPPDSRRECDPRADLSTIHGAEATAKTTKEAN